MKYDTDITDSFSLKQNVNDLIRKIGVMKGCIKRGSLCK